MAAYVQWVLGSNGPLASDPPTNHHIAGAQRYDFFVENQRQPTGFASFFIYVNYEKLAESVAGPR